MWGFKGYEESIGNPEDQGEEEIIGEVSGEKRGFEQDEYSEFDVPLGGNAKKKKTDNGVQVDGAALVQAIRTGSFDKLKELVENEADVNEKVCGSSCLMYATFYGRDDMVEYLLSVGADINSQNLTGVAALHWAVERKHKSTLQLLLKKGANVNIADNTGLTALHKAARLGFVDMMRILINEGNADVSKEALKAVECCTVLQDAAAFGKVEAVRYLLESSDVDVDQKDGQGRTALHRAAQKGQAACAKVLVDFGADINVLEDTKRTPLHWAAFFGHLEVFKYLLENGADSNMKDKYGLTPDVIVKNRRHTSLIEYLIVLEKQKQQQQCEEEDELSFLE